MIHTFNAGDGASVIDTIGTNDTIQIEVVDADLTYTREGDNLVIKYTDSDTVTLTNYFNGSTAIESTTAFYDIKVKAAEDYTSCNLLEQIIKVNGEKINRAMEDADSTKEYGLIVYVIKQQQGIIEKAQQAQQNNLEKIQQETELMNEQLREFDNYLNTESYE